MAILTPRTALTDATDRPWIAVQLKAPAEWRTYPNGINRHGLICGFRGIDGEVTRAIVWRTPDADPEVLPVLSDAEASWSCIPNDRGKIPGRTAGRAVLWNRDGEIEDLHARLDDFSFSEAWVVNRRGTAVGYGRPTGLSVSRAIRWPRSGRAEILEFDEMTYQSTWAYAMNERDVACGVASLLPAGRPLHAVYWPRGRALVDLHPSILEAMPTAVASVALEALDDGRIAGSAWEPIGTDVTVQRPWIYDPRRKEVELIDAGGAAVATLWAGAGRRFLLGYLDADWVFDSLAVASHRPALWARTKPGRTSDWRITPVAMPDGVVGFSLWGGNSRGTLIGVGATAAGAERAYVLTR